MDFSSFAFNTMLQMPALDEVAFLDCVEGAITDPEVLAIEDPECACEQSTYWATYFGANCPEVNVMYWYHPDYLGSVEAVTDANGEVYQFFHNTIWGEPLQQQKAFLYNSFSSRYRFNGKERDWETGNFYYGARYYDPKISVWLSVDELAIFSNYESPYVFVSNNPLRFIDPDGRIKRDAAGKIVYKPTRIITVTHPSGQVAKMQEVVIFTDKGTKIIAYQNLTDNESFDTNCHGTTFGDGEFWINNDQVDKILKDEYDEVKREDALVADVVVYDDQSGKDVHSVTVVNSDNDGKDIDVKGLGGMQTKTSETTVETGWNRPNSSYTFYRRKPESLILDLIPRELKKIEEPVDGTNLMLR